MSAHGPTKTPAPPAAERATERAAERAADPLSGPLIDVAAVLERLGGDREMLALLVADFREEYPLMLAEVDRAAAAGNAKALVDAAHKLKGAVSNLSCGAPYRAAGELEQLARRSDWTQIPAFCAHLRRTLAALEPEMAALLVQENM